jgi:hypothetical protein
MSPNQVAQWFADNPGSWFAFLDELRAVASDEQLIMLADDLQYMVYGEYTADPEDDPGEQQEWFDFDPDC